MIEILTRELHNAGIDATAEQVAQMAQFFAMLTERNKVMNLTTITEEKSAARLHFVDSLLLLRYLPELRESSAHLADIGTGAGFPGIPLKILCPMLHVTLIDAQQKKLSFLEEAIDSLHLNDTGSITTAHGRAEDLAGKKGAFRESFDFVTARAVAALSVLAEYCLPFVKMGGTFIAYKSDSVQIEAQESAGALRLLGGEVQRTERYVLPGGEEKRALIFITKTGRTPGKYPRKAGTPAREPL